MHQRTIGDDIDHTALIEELGEFSLIGNARRANAWTEK
jgi:hypothetical protein